MDKMEERLRKLFDEKLSGITEQLRGFDDVKQQLSDLDAKTHAPPKLIIPDRNALGIMGALPQFPPPPPPRYHSAQVIFPNSPVIPDSNASSSVGKD
ncbi:hypothetical protein C2845_PM01G01620 [Panicum miliaceum]|uniref:Uncharacterized protein n=1 Tax=Panicum miliaceum TaxID=4540 RepID=A0A3L6TFJ0_PANMI|nr:hypothetical protein C2845_PM01G01620 [Panicum miliaceum]